MPPSFQEELRRRMEDLGGKTLRRSLQRSEGVDFTSNDYLGLAAHPRLRQRLGSWLEEEEACGAPASRLLRGNTPRHEALERRLARFKGTEGALLFPSGYQANVGLLTALIQPQDRVLSDQLNHASLIDGLRLAGCTKVIFPHRDVDAVKEALARPHGGGRTFLVTESLFSMDATVAPLDRYLELARRHGAELIVDEAHATGLFGETGAGLVEHFGVAGEVTAVVSTFGKAFGVGGAFVGASEVVVETLVNRARSFIFSTAPPPALLVLLEAALDLVEEEPWRRERVMELAQRLRQALKLHRLEVLGEDGPVVPVVLGENERALAVAEHLRKAGLDARAVRPPTVPEGTARLRLSVHADHLEEEVDRLAEEIAVAAARGVEVSA